MGARGSLHQRDLGCPPLHGHGSPPLLRARGVGTLWGLTHAPLPVFFQRITAFFRSLVQRPSGGYDGRAFDLMFTIADVLEADHGWSFEQSDAWLERMGLWEDEF